MADFLEILKYTLPALIVFFTSWLLIRKFLDSDQKLKKIDMMYKNEQYILPIRLQAYERLVLFLERISPESLLMRMNSKKMTSQELHSELLTTIRAEYEHNLSQQIYVSRESWEVIRNARSNIVNIINEAAKSIEPGSPSIKLSQTILESIIDKEDSPANVAIDFLKKEIKQLF
ncbi:MAG: hypothetical protein EA408_07600 [Marinilabiliales bacterium]|nr:MAG: hypothetical protein EA408_07600 [Marinilabiliales bacterium]